MERGLHRRVLRCVAACQACLAVGITTVAALAVHSLVATKNVWFVSSSSEWCYFVIAPPAWSVEVDTGAEVDAGGYEWGDLVLEPTPELTIHNVSDWYDPNDCMQGAQPLEHWTANKFAEEKSVVEWGQFGQGLFAWVLALFGWFTVKLANAFMPFISDAMLRRADPTGGADPKKRKAMKLLVKVWAFTLMWGPGLLLMPLGSLARIEEKGEPTDLISIRTDPLWWGGVIAFYYPIVVGIFCGNPVLQYVFVSCMPNEVASYLAAACLLLVLNFLPYHLGLTLISNSSWSMVLGVNLKVAFKFDIKDDLTARTSVLQLMLLLGQMVDAVSFLWKMVPENPSEKVVSVRVPHGAGPGAIIELNDGSGARVTVPPGVGPGYILQVSVPCK